MSKIFLLTILFLHKDNYLIVDWQLSSEQRILSFRLKKNYVYTAPKQCKHFQTVFFW